MSRFGCVAACTALFARVPASFGTVGGVGPCYSGVTQVQVLAGMGGGDRPACRWFGGRGDDQAQL